MVHWARANHSTSSEYYVWTCESEAGDKKETLLPGSVQDLQYPAVCISVPRVSFGACTWELGGWTSWTWTCWKPTLFSNFFVALDVDSNKRTSSMLDQLQALPRRRSHHLLLAAVWPFSPRPLLCYAVQLTDLDRLLPPLLPSWYDWIILDPFNTYITSNII